MRTFVTGLVLTLAAHLAHADAALSGAGPDRFPSDVTVAVDVRAQVEMTTMVLRFADLPGGDYVLTVPGPKLAYVVGVELDRGAGFFPAPMVGEAPPPALAGSSAAQRPEVAAWLGHDPLRADLAGLDAGPLTVRVRFQRLLRRVRGAVSFTAGVARSPLRPADDPGANVELAVTLETLRPLASLDVSAGAQVDRKDSGAVMTAHGTGAALLDIRYAESGTGIDVHFLTHRAPGADPLGSNDGYFLLIIDADDASPDSAEPRTLSLVIDESGSMAGDKIVQATAAARAMLEHLRPVDAFNILAFESTVHAFRAGPVPATPANLAAARDYIKQIAALGGTDLGAGIKAGLTGVAAPDPRRFDTLILLSDGHATVGQTDGRTIHDDALRVNQAQARIFTFAVGSDADLPLMEALARSNRGASFQLNDQQAGTELVDRVVDLFADIDVPRLTDLGADVVGIGARDVLPQQMRDLFSGGQAILVGRYAQPATGAVRLTGNQGGTPFARSLDADAPASNTDNEFIKYVWAGEQVGKLLADLGRGGNLATLRAQITALGLGYRMQTPYTSFATRGVTPDGSGASSGGGSSGGSFSGGSSSGGGGGGANGPLEALAVLLLAGGLLLGRRRGVR